MEVTRTSDLVNILTSYDSDKLEKSNSQRQNQKIITESWIWREGCIPLQPSGYASLSCRQS